MELPRNTLQEFHYSSTMAGTAVTLVPVASVSNSVGKTVRIADIKATCGGTARTIKFYSDGYADAGSLELDLPANSATDLSWQIPLRFNIVSSTGAPRNFVASASGAGVKYTISGYVDK